MTEALKAGEVNVTYKTGRAHKWASSAVFLFVVLAFAAGPPAAGQGLFGSGFSLHDAVIATIKRARLCNEYTRPPTETTLQITTLQSSSELIVPCPEYTPQLFLNIDRLISDAPVIFPSTPPEGVANLRTHVFRVDFEPEKLTTISLHSFHWGASDGFAFTSPGLLLRRADEVRAEQRSDVYVGTGVSTFQFFNRNWELVAYVPLRGAHIGGGDQDQPVDAAVYFAGDFDDNEDDITFPDFKDSRIPFQDAPGEEFIALIVGTTRSVNFTTTPDALDATCGADGQCDGTQDGFFTVMRYPSVGPQELLYSTYIGGSGRDFPRRVVASRSGIACVAGGTSSPDLVTTSNAFDADCGVDGACENDDAFVMCFDLGLAPESKGGEVQQQGVRLVYSSYFGGSGFENTFALGMDPDGNVFLGGPTNSDDLPVSTGASATLLAGGIDTYVARFNPLAEAGESFIWATYLGGSGTDSPTDLVVDPFGRAWVVGGSQSLDFPLTPDAFDRTCDDGTACTADLLGDAFVTVISQDGRALEFSSYLGGTAGDRITDIDMDFAGNAYIVGQTRSPDFPVSPEAYDTTCGSDGTCDGGNENSFFGVIASPAISPPEVAMLHGANFLPFISPNTWTSVFLREPVAVGARIWGGPDFADNRLPSQLDGVEVRFNGEPGYVSFISSGQFNVLSRSASLPPIVKVEVTTPDGDLPPVWVRVFDFAPAFFMFDPQGRRYIAAVHLDGTFVGPPGLFGPALTTRPAMPGDIIQVTTVRLKVE